MSNPWNGARRWTGRILKLAVAVAIVLGIVYQVRFAPVPVKSHEIKRGEIRAEVMGTGTLEAHIRATVSSRISGRVGEVLVDQGERVTTGQILVRLDAEELEQQVEIARANQEAALAAIERLNADRTRATAVFTQARAHHTRIQTLVERNATTSQDLDQATESLAVAEAGLSRAEAAINEAQKELVAAQKTLEYHRTRLADTEIKAPFDGLVIRRQRDPGDVVLPGSPILTVVSTSELWISAWVDETEMGRLHEQQPARIIFRSAPDEAHAGSVVRLGREADRETREFIVDVRVDDLPENWAIGQRAEVFIETDRKESAVLLPEEYIVRQVGQTGIYVEQDAVARWWPTQIGLRNAALVELVDGPEVGTTVVTPSDPRNRLREGQRIVTP